MANKTKNKDSLENLIKDYTEFIFKILAYLPFNFESAKRFILGSFTRKDYNIEVITLFKEYIKYYVINLFSILIGLWWFFLIFIGIGLIFAPILVIGVIMSIFFVIISIIFQLIYFLISAYLFKIIANYFEGDLTFNESFSLIVYAGILQMVFIIPIMLSYGIFVGIFLSPLLSVIPFYALYFIYKELNNKFKMKDKKAAYTIITHFVIENVLFLGLVFGFYFLFILIPLLLSFF